MGTKDIAGSTAFTEGRPFTSRASYVPTGAELSRESLYARFMRASFSLLGAALVLSSAAADAQQPAQPAAPAQQPAQPAAPAPANTQPPPPQAPPWAGPYPHLYPYAAPYPYPYGAPSPGLAPNAPKYRNNSMRIAGIVLTGIASALLVSGILCQALIPNSGGVSLVISLPQIGLSTVIAAVGVPLWVLGAKPPEVAKAVSIGPGSLRITF